MISFDRKEIDGMDNKVQLKEQELVGQEVQLVDIYPRTDTSSIEDPATGYSLDVRLEHIMEIINNKLTRVVNSVNGKTGVVVLDGSDVGLGKVDDVSFEEIKDWVIEEFNTLYHIKRFRIFSTYHELDQFVEDDDPDKQDVAFIVKEWNPDERLGDDADYRPWVGITIGKENQNIYDLDYNAIPINLIKGTNDALVYKNGILSLKLSNYDDNPLWILGKNQLNDPDSAGLNIDWRSIMHKMKYMKGFYYNRDIRMDGWTLFTRAFRVYHNTINAFKKDGKYVHPFATPTETEDIENQQEMLETLKTNLDKISPYICKEIHEESSHFTGYIWDGTKMRTTMFQGLVGDYDMCFDKYIDSQPSKVKSEYISYFKSTHPNYDETEIDYTTDNYRYWLYNIFTWHYENWWSNWYITKIDSTSSYSINGKGFYPFLRSVVFAQAPAANTTTNTTIDTRYLNFTIKDGIIEEWTSYVNLIENIVRSNGAYDIEDLGINTVIRWWDDYSAAGFLDTNNTLNTSTVLVAIFINGKRIFNPRRRTGEFLMYAGTISEKDLIFIDTPSALENLFSKLMMINNETQTIGDGETAFSAMAKSSSYFSAELMCNHAMVGSVSKSVIHESDGAKDYYTIFFQTFTPYVTWGLRNEPTFKLSNKSNSRILGENSDAVGDITTETVVATAKKYDPKYLDETPQIISSSSYLDDVSGIQILSHYDQLDIEWRDETDTTNRITKQEVDDGDYSGRWNETTNKYEGDEFDSKHGKYPRFDQTEMEKMNKVITPSGATNLYSSWSIRGGGLFIPTDASLSVSSYYNYGLRELQSDSDIITNQDDNDSEKARNDYGKYEYVESSTEFPGWSYQSRKFNNWYNNTPYYLRDHEVFNHTGYKNPPNFIGINLNKGINVVKYTGEDTGSDSNTDGKQYTDTNINQDDIYAVPMSGLRIVDPYDGNDVDGAHKALTYRDLGLDPDVDWQRFNVSSVVGDLTINVEPKYKIYVWKYLRSTMNLSKLGAAILMGNLMAESMLDPKAVAKSDLLELHMTNDEFWDMYADVDEDGEAAKKFVMNQFSVGLAQWTNPARKRGMLAFFTSEENASKNYNSLCDIDFQLDYMNYEMSNELNFNDFASSDYITEDDLIKKVYTEEDGILVGRIGDVPEDGNSEWYYLYDTANQIAAIGNSITTDDDGKKWMYGWLRSQHKPDDVGSMKVSAILPEGYSELESLTMSDMIFDTGEKVNATDNIVLTYGYNSLYDEMGVVLSAYDITKSINEQDDDIFLFGVNCHFPTASNNIDYPIIYYRKHCDSEDPNSCKMMMADSANEEFIDAGNFASLYQSTGYTITTVTLSGLVAYLDMAKSLGDEYFSVGGACQGGVGTDNTFNAGELSGETTTTLKIGGIGSTYETEPEDHQSQYLLSSDLNASSFKFYSLKWYRKNANNENELIHEYIPVIPTGENTKPKLYDKVTKTFIDYTEMSNPTYTCGDITAIDNGTETVKLGYIKELVSIHGVDGVTNWGEVEYDFYKNMQEWYDLLHNEQENLTSDELSQIILKGSRYFDSTYFRSGLGVNQVISDRRIQYAKHFYSELKDLENTAPTKDDIIETTDTSSNKTDTMSGAISTIEAVSLIPKSGGLMVNVGNYLEIDPVITSSDGLNKGDKYYDWGKVNVRIGGGLIGDGHNRITINTGEGCHINENGQLDIDVKPMGITLIDPENFIAYDMENDTWYHQNSQTAEWSDSDPFDTDNKILILGDGLKLTDTIETPVEEEEEEEPTPTPTPVVETPTIITRNAGNPGELYYFLVDGMALRSYRTSEHCSLGMLNWLRYSTNVAVPISTSSVVTGYDLVPMVTELNKDNQFSASDLTLDGYHSGWQNFAYQFAETYTKNLPPFQSNSLVNAFGGDSSGFIDLNVTEFIDWLLDLQNQAWNGNVPDGNFLTEGRWRNSFYDIGQKYYYAINQDDAHLASVDTIIEKYINTGNP